TGDDDLVSRLQRASAPAPSRQKIRTLKFGRPFRALPLIVLDRKKDQCMWIEILQRGDCSLQRDRLRVVVFSGAVVGGYGQRRDEQPRGHKETDRHVELHTIPRKHVEPTSQSRWQTSQL